MSTVSIDVFKKFIQSEVQGCDIYTLERNLRFTITDFCEKTWVLQKGITHIIDAEDIDAKNNKIEYLNTKLKKLNKQILARDTISKQIGLLEYKVTKHIQKIKFFTDNDICKTCGQDIDEDFKNLTIKEHEDFRIEKDGDIKKLQITLDEIMKINDKKL